jgi:hypothetical protein
MLVWNEEQGQQDALYEIYPLAAANVSSCGQVTDS